MILGYDPSVAMAGHKREARLRTNLPAIHAFALIKIQTWMPGTGPGMTVGQPQHRLNAPLGGQDSIGEGERQQHLPTKRPDTPWASGLFNS